VPLVVPLALWGVALLITLMIGMLSPSYRRALEDTVRNIAVIGGKLAQAIGWLYAVTLDFFQDIARPYEAKLAEWFNSLLLAIRTPFDEMAALATRTKTALEYIATDLIPDKIRAITNPIVTRVNGIASRIDNLRADLTDFDNGISARIRQLTEQVWDKAIGPVVALQSTVAALPGLIDARIRALAATVYTEAIQPIGRIADIELPRINIDLSDLRKLLDGVREWVVPVSLVFTGAAVVELLRHVRKCQSKTEKLCQFDMDAYDDLLGLAFTLPSLALIVETMRQSTNLLDEVLPDLRETLR
jgi:hypothetical protein